MNQHRDLTPQQYFESIGAWPRKAGSVRPAYIIGFVLSLLCTGVAYYFAAATLLPPHGLFISLGVLACIQFIVQLVCFLHMGRETASRDRLIVLLFALVIVFILVAGSLWIMISLDGRMMPTEAEMMKFMDSQSGL